MSNNKSDSDSIDIFCNDTPTKYAHLGWRLLAALLTWFLLGYSVTPNSTFFASVSLFVAPIMFDYFKYTPRDSIRIWINRIAKFVNILFLIVAILGLFGIIVISNYSGELIMRTASAFIIPDFYIMKVRCFWFSLFSIVLICAVDWAVNTSPLEKAIIKEQKGV